MYENEASRIWIFSGFGLGTAMRDLEVIIGTAWTGNIAVNKVLRNTKITSSRRLIPGFWSFSRELGRIGHAARKHRFARIIKIRHEVVALCSNETG